MLRLLLIPVGLFLLLSGAMIWSRGESTRPADFIFIDRGEINTLDPNAMSWLHDIRVAYALWEGLYAVDPQTLEAVPGAAERIEASEDGRTYTFHLRPEGRWSNGDPVTSGDFVFAWQRTLEHPSYYSYLLHYIDGAREYQDRIAEWADARQQAHRAGDSRRLAELVDERPVFTEITGVRAPDDLTLEVTLTNPVTFFPDLVSFPPFFPLHEPSMRPFGETGPDGKTRYRAEFTRAGNLVTNGPFRLEIWQFKRRVRLAASEYYWDRRNVRSRVIDMLSFDDPQAAFLKYESGGAHWLANVSAEISPELYARSRPDLHVFPGFGTYFLTLNCSARLPDGRENPLYDPRVRRALAMAIDKRPIVEGITRLNQPVATTFIPPDAFADYRSPRGLEYDPEAARALLAEAGYPGGRGFPQVSLLFNNEGDHRYIAQNIRSQWERQLGVRIDLEGVEVNIFRQRNSGRQYAIARAGWIGDYNDPSTFTDKYLSTSHNNTAGWVNEQYDQLCARAAAETDPQKRLRLLEQAEQILLEEAPIIPIYHYVNVFMHREDVRGIPLHARNMVMLKSVYVQPQ